MERNVVIRGPHFMIAWLAWGFSNDCGPSDFLLEPPKLLVQLGLVQPHWEWIWPSVQWQGGWMVWDCCFPLPLLSSDVFPPPLPWEDPEKCETQGRGRNFTSINAVFQPPLPAATWSTLSPSRDSRVRQKRCLRKGSAFKGAKESQGRSRLSSLLWASSGTEFAWLLLFGLRKEQKDRMRFFGNSYRLKQLGRSGKAGEQHW